MIVCYTSPYAEMQFFVILAMPKTIPHILVLQVLQFSLASKSVIKTLKVSPRLLPFLFHSYIPTILLALFQYGLRIRI